MSFFDFPQDGIRNVEMTLDNYHAQLIHTFLIIPENQKITFFVDGFPTGRCPQAGIRNAEMTLDDGNLYNP